MKTQFLPPVCSILAILAPPASAEALISESFDYGAPSGNLADVSSWGSSSSFNDYVHDGGLDVATINGE